MKTLTSQNIESGLEVKQSAHPEYGTWIIGQDRNGWTAKGRSGEKMLFERDFHFWEIVG